MIFSITVVPCNAPVKKGGCVVAIPYFKAHTCNDVPGAVIMSNSAEEVRTILIVDDDAVIRRVVSRVAETIPGIHARTASCVDEAISMASTEHFDLIISDLNMPGQTGFAIIDYIKAHGVKTPVVIYSGSLPAWNGAEVQRKGADMMLAKPADADTLKDVICRYTGVTKPGR